MTNREKYRAAFTVHAPDRAVQAAIDHTQRPYRRRSVRPILAAALLAGLLVTGAGAEAGTGAVSNLLIPLFGGSRTELLEEIGRPVNASVTAGGYTVTAEAIIGDQFSMVLAYTLTRDDGQPISGDCDFEDIRSNITGKGGSLIQFFQDNNPGDNQVQFYQVCSTEGLPKMLSVSFRDLRIEEENQVICVEGPWDMTFTRRYPNCSRQLSAADVTFTDDTGTTYTVSSMYLSYLGLHVFGTADSSVLSMPSASVTLEDGRTIELGETTFGYSSREGRATAFDWHPSYQYGLDMDLISPDQVISVTLSGTTIPVS